MARARTTEYGRAVANAERAATYFVGQPLPSSKPHFRAEIERRISELQLAWRDMSDEEKAALKAETMRKRQRVVHEKPSVGVARGRQLDAAYRAMTPEQRFTFDEKMRAST